MDVSKGREGHGGVFCCLLIEGDAWHCAGQREKWCLIYPLQFESVSWFIEKIGCENE